MKLLSLKLSNFRQHASTEITFPPEGLTGILGTNESGKSTIIEAVMWILYGARAIRGTMKGIRWSGAVGREIARGELAFEVGGKRYRARRTENDAWLYEDGKDTPIAKSISAVDDKIPQIIGMDLEEFSTTYLCLQKDLGRLSSMGGTDRKQFILGVMGVGKVDSALKSCRSRKNDLKNEVQGLKEGLGEREPLENELTTSDIGVSESHEHVSTTSENAEKAESAHQAAKQKLEESTTRQNQHRELEQNRSRASQQLEAADREITRLQEEEKKAAEASERVKKADEQLKDLPVLREERDAIREVKARVSERTRLEQTIKSQDEEIGGLVIKAGDLTKSRPAEKHDDGYIRDKSEAKGKLESLQEDRNNRLIEAEKAAATARADAERDEKQFAHLEPLGESAECPTCGQALRETFQKVLSDLRLSAEQARKDEKELQNKIDTLKDPSDDEMEIQIQLEWLQEQIDEAKQIREKREQIDVRLIELEQEINQKNDVLDENRRELAELPEASYSEERLQEVESRIQALDNLNNQVESDRALAGRINSIMEEQVRWKQQRGSSALLIEQATKDIEVLGFDPEIHTQLFAAAERAREDLTGTKAALARAEEALKAAQERSERAQKALSDWDQRAERLKDLQEDLRIHTQSSERLADFRTAVAASIRPELEELTSGFIHILTDGRHEAVTLSEEFDVILREGGLDVEVVSGGTEDITAIALRLAISQMIAARAGHPLSLLIFDEPFGSLDEVRRRNVIDLLERLKGTFEQVIVVTHVDEIKDSCDQVIQVEFDERCNRSHVTAEWITEEIETEALVESAELIEEPA